MIQYNDKYEIVFYEDKYWRFYDKNAINSLATLYSEIQITLIELIEKNNFKVFYFSCKPATNLKVSIINNKIDLEEENIQLIKNNQEEDFFYFYKNNICQICYSFLKLDENNSYYFDFMLVVKQDFDLNSFCNHKLKSVKIINSEEICLNKLTFEFVKKIFEQRVLVLNNNSPSLDKNCYEITNLSYGFKNYINNIKNGDENIDRNEYLNFDSFYFYKNFDQDLYIKKCFRLLCSHIWSTNLFYYRELNNFGLRIFYKDIYNLNKVFLTNSNEFFDSYSFGVVNEKLQIKKENYTYGCLLDDLEDQFILLTDIGFNFNENQKTNFENLEVHSKKV